MSPAAPNHPEVAADLLLARCTAWLTSLNEPGMAVFLEPLAAAHRLRSLQPNRLPVLGWLGELEAGASELTRRLVADLVEAAPRLKWDQTYDAADFGSRFLERYGWTELAGLRGPFHSDEVAAGFLLLGPDTEYPAHRHQAEEIYVVLSGTAAWMRDGADAGALPPGAIIHHPSLMPHAVRTSRQPLLALYLWRGGDLVQKSEIDAVRAPA